LAQLLREIEANKYIHDYRKYLTLDEDIRATLPFKKYYTLVYKRWPKDLDEDYFKSIG
jgi:hypothetical protein